MSTAQFLGIIAGVMLAQFLYGFVKRLVENWRAEPRGRCDVCGRPVLADGGTFIRMTMTGRPDTTLRRCLMHPLTSDDVDEATRKYRGRP